MCQLLLITQKEILDSCFEEGNVPHDWKEVFIELMETNPNNKFLWMRLGQYYRQMNLFNKTVQCWERVLEIDPKRALMHDNLGDVYDELANPGVTARQLADQRMLLGLTRDQCSENAKAHWDEAIKLNPEIYQIWHRMGVYYEDQINQDERVEPSLAIRQYRKVLMFPETHISSMVRLGWLLVRSGTQDEEAVSLLVKAQKIDPKCSRSQDYIQAITPIGMNRPEILTRIQRKVNQQLSRK